MITFTCKGKGCSPRQWEGSLEILQRGNPCEAELCARGSRFHLIVGKHSYGNYLCIPANSHFLRTAGSYSADSQEHTPDTNDYAAKGSLHE